MVGALEPQKHHLTIRKSCQAIFLGCNAGAGVNGRKRREGVMRQKQRIGLARYPGGGSGWGIIGQICAIDAGHRWVARSLSALPMTSTELMLIAALAIIGLSNSPKAG